MNFIAPLLLIGVAAIAVPIAIHLFGKRRAKTVKFAAIDFLFQSNRKTARNMQVREKALLIVRILACLAIPLALAKPFTSCKQSGPAVQRGAQAAVILVDDSFSSSISTQSGMWIAAASKQAQAILDQLGASAEVAIVLASQGSDMPTELTRDHLRLRDQLLALTPTNRPADTRRALEASAKLLATSGHSRKTVFLLALLTKNSLATGDPAWGDAGPILQVIDVKEPSRSNRAVTKVAVASDASAGIRGIAVTAEIWNASEQEAKNLDVALKLGDEVVARGKLDLAPWEKKTKRFLAAMPKNQKSVDVAVSIPADALPIDDTRHARAVLQNDVRALIVNGDPRTNKRDDEVFYLETALRPGDRSDAGTTVSVITADDLNPQSLLDIDVCVLANVRSLPRAKVELLTAWVRNGGGLLTTVGNQVDAVVYNQEMASLLPQALGDIVDATWGSQGEDLRSRLFHLEKIELTHPVFAVFSKQATELRDAQFSKVFLLTGATGNSDRKVLARYTNGGIALIEAKLGSGTIALFTSTIDRDWNDLAIHPGYLPFTQQLVRFLAKRDAPIDSTDHLVGNTVALPVGGANKLEVRGPEQNVVFNEQQLSNRTAVLFSKTTAPGQYSVRAVDENGAALSKTELSFAVNVDPSGSDLRAAPATLLPKSGTAGAATNETDLERRVELWHAIAAIFLLLLLAEGILLQRA